MPGSTLLAKLKTQLSLEYNCCPEDFDREETVITIPKANPGRRPYSPEPPFFLHGNLRGQRGDFRRSLPPSLAGAVGVRAAGHLAL